MGYWRGVSKDKDIYWVAGNLIQMTEHCKVSEGRPNQKAHIMLYPFAIWFYWLSWKVVAYKMLNGAEALKSLSFSLFFSGNPMFYDANFSPLDEPLVGMSQEPFSADIRYVHFMNISCFGKWRFGIFPDRR